MISLWYIMISSYDKLHRLCLKEYVSVLQKSIQMKTFGVEERLLKATMSYEQTLAGCEQSVKKSRSSKG